MLLPKSRALADNSAVAGENRATLARTGTLAVLMTGPPGTGKTAVIHETLRRLPHGTHAAVIVAHSAADRDLARLSGLYARGIGLDVTFPDALGVADALRQIDLRSTDLVFIEGIGGICGVPRLGQDLTVVCLSVSGGDDKAAEYRGLIAGAALLLLTQTDLRHHIPFDQAKLLADSRAANPDVDLIEISCPQGRGLDEWMRWLSPHWQHKRAAARPYEELLQSEWFFG